MSVSNIFGAPRTGVHAIRVFDVAVVDLALTVVAAYPISRYFGWGFVPTAFGLVALSVPVHILFGVQTKMTTFF